MQVAGEDLLKIIGDKEVQILLLTRKIDELQKRLEGIEKSAEKEELQ